MGNEDLLIEAIEEFVDNPDDYRRAIESPETADCFIRLYVLSESVSRVFDYVMDEIEWLDKSEASDAIAQ